MAGIPTAEIAKRQYFGRYKILPWLNLSDCRKVERWLQAHTWTTIESRWIGNSTLCVSLLILGNWCISAYLHLCISAYLHQIGCWYHTDQYLTVNIDVSACMVSISYLVQICRDAEMQICRYAPVSQDQKWHTQSGVTDPSGFNCCPSVRLKSSLDFPTVWQIESWEYFIYRPKYCLFAISAVGIPAMNTETDKHTLHRLYFLGIRKKP